MKGLIKIVCCFMLAVSVTACGSEGTKPQAEETVESQTETESVSAESLSKVDNSNVDMEDVTEETEKSEVTRMKVQIGDSVFQATLEQNQAAKELVSMIKEAPVTITMSDYSGFEKVGSLGTSLTSSNSQTTTQSGDIVLYNGNQIVIFYGSNSWSYTRLGKIDDLSEWTEALGSGDVTVTFSIESI